MFVGLSAHSFATIANFQWFSKLPSPLNGMVEGNHWDQWFSNGFGVRQPLVTMVFDGCAPLVRRWNGYVPSSKSKPVSVKLWKLIHLYWHFWTFLGEVSSKIPQLCHISPQWVRPDSKFIFHYIDQDDYNELLTILLVEMSKHKKKMCPLVIWWRRVSVDNMVNWTVWVDH